MVVFPENDSVVAQVLNVFFTIAGKTHQTYGFLYVFN